MDTERLKYLIKSLYNGFSSKSEKEELNTWMNTDFAHTASYEAWINASNTIDESTKIEIWDNVESEITDIDYACASVKNTRIAYPIFKFVATVAILLCTTFASYLLYTNFNSNNDDNIYSFEVLAGQKGSLKLADGTLVHLNSLSKISFSGDYNNTNRIVTLNGEAYFEVAKNPNKKFIVSCNGMDIEALGTEFNVKAYAADSLITTTLAEGKVKVSSNNQSLILYPKDVATYYVNHSIINSSKIEDLSIADYWRSEKLVFASEPLSSIAKTIERMYGVKIDIKDSELEGMKFTGTIQNNSLHIVMDVISLSYPLTYTITDSIITISAKPNAIKKHKYN